MLRIILPQRKLPRIFAAPLVAAALAILAGCDRPTAGPAAATQPARAVRVQVARSVVRDLPVTLTVSGSLFGDEQATLSAKVGGRIAETMADVGDRVGPGAVLAQIDPTDYRIEVAQRELALKEALARLGLGELPGSEFDVRRIAPVERAKFQRDNASAKLERAAALMSADRPPISEQEFADMQTQFEVARRDYDVAVLEANSQVAAARALDAQLQAARQRLAESTVRAPEQPANAPKDHFAVAARLVSAGEFVQAGTPLFRVISDRPIKFRGAVPERFSNQIRPGQPAVLRVEGVGAVPGEVRRVNPAIDPQSRTFDVEIVTPNADGRLRPGGFARATITTGEAAGVTLVPTSGVVSFAGVDRVFVIREGKAAALRVTTGDRVDQDWIALAETLPVNTPIILSGDRGIADGIPVELADPTTQPRRRSDAPPGS